MGHSSRSIFPTTAFIKKKTEHQSSLSNLDSLTHEEIYYLALGYVNSVITDNENKFDVGHAEINKLAFLIKTLIYLEKGNINLVNATYKKSLDLQEKYEFDDSEKIYEKNKYLLQILSKKNLSLEELDKTLTELKNYLENNNTTKNPATGQFYNLYAQFLLQKGSKNEALNYWKKARDISLLTGGINTEFTKEMTEHISQLEKELSQTFSPKLYGSKIESRKKTLKILLGPEEEEYKGFDFI